MSKLSLYLKLKKGESSADAIMRMLSNIGKEEQHNNEDSFPGIQDISEIPQDVYTTKTNNEIKELALRLYRGEIFTSLQLRDLEHELSRVFMPIGFLDIVSIKVLTESNVGMFYSEMKHAAPRCINGLPMFFSVDYISEEDTDRLLKKYNQVVDLMEAL